MKNLFNLLVLAVIFLTFVPKVLAADVDFICNPNGCSQIGALFNETGMHPGKTITRTVRVKNDYSESRSFAMEPINLIDSTPSVADALFITITDTDNKSMVYGPDSLTDWKNDGFKSIGGLDPGASRTYEFKVNFIDVGNDYQNQKLTFDIKLGFENLGAGTPVITGGTSTTGAIGGVLGAFTKIFNPETTPETTNYINRQILGAECVKNVTPWWIFLAFEVLMFLAILTRSARAGWGSGKVFTILVIIATLSQIAHQATGCDCIISPWCSRYLLINIVILFCPIAWEIVTKRIKNRKTLDNP